MKTLITILRSNVIKSWFFFFQIICLFVGSAILLVLSMPNTIYISGLNLMCMVVGTIGFLTVYTIGIYLSETGIFNSAKQLDIEKKNYKEEIARLRKVRNEYENLIAKVK